MKKEHSAVARDGPSRLHAEMLALGRRQGHGMNSIIDYVVRYVPTWIISSARCKLCWRITVVVFASILVIESAILIPSSLRYIDVAIGQLRDLALSAVETEITLGASSPSPDFLQGVFSKLIGHQHIVGIIARTEDGSAVAEAGEAIETGRDGNFNPAPEAVLSYFEPGKVRRHDFEWKLQNFSAPLLVTVRVDTTDVSGALRSYVLRIAELVAFIVVFVTMVTMLVLQYEVLGPILRLRRSMILAGASPQKAKEFVILADRSDELGEVALAHNHMLRQVEESFRRDQAMAKEREHYISHHDALTGLPNRTAFLEHLKCSPESGGNFCCTAMVCVINFIGLRDINAGYGPKFGDRLLKEIGERLRRCVAPSDFVARIGGDRFAVAKVAPHSKFEATGFADRIYRQLAMNYSIDQTSIPGAVCIGISRAGPLLSDPESFLNEAEIVLNRAKSEHGTGYQFFDPAMAEEARQRQTLSRDLESALAGEELFVLYQPKFEINGSNGVTLCGAETLLRWGHPERGLIPPDIFVPIAEYTGLIAPIGEYVLRKACAQIKSWLIYYGWSPCVSVNVSAQQFADPSLHNLLSRMINEHGVPPGRLELEVTETTAMHDVKATQAVLGNLRTMGIRISIDDFGTGYSSLHYLTQLEIDTIKIDKTFVRGIGADKNAEAICEAIIRMGIALKKRVIAEGVEKDEQLIFLKAQGCHEIQGFLLGTPITAADFEARYLNANRAIQGRDGAQFSPSSGFGGDDTSRSLT